jgi:uncharacterized lipoprotein NlpE involved in copper resistance
MQMIASLVRKKLVLAGIAAALVGSASYAFAAGISITSASLGAGNANVTACQSSTTTSYASAYDSTVSPGHYKVNSVHLTLGAACQEGFKISVTLERTNPTTSAALAPVTLADYAIQAGEPGTGADIPVTSTVSAAEVSGVSVAISS